MLVESGYFSSAMQYHQWIDCVPLGTPIERASGDDWRSALERVLRYRVPDGTPVVRVECHDSEPMPTPPPGFVFVDA